MFCPKRGTFAKGSAQMKADFGGLFTQALKRRLYPFTALRVDDLAYAIGGNGYTLRSWMRGQTCPSGPMLAACIDYFARCGDHTFLQELFPSAVVPLVQRNQKAERALAFVESFRDVLQGEAVA